MNVILADANTQMIVPATALITLANQFAEDVRIANSLRRQGEKQQEILHNTFSKQPIVGWRMKPGVTRIDSPHTQLLRGIPLPSTDLTEFMSKFTSQLPIESICNLYRLALIGCAFSECLEDP